MEKRESEIKELRRNVEELYSRLESIEEFLGLIYEDWAKRKFTKTGKLPLTTGLKDLEDH